MNKTHWPRDSRLYAERAFQAKEAMHRQREEMSFARKLEALDRLLAWGRQIKGMRNRRPGSAPRKAHGVLMELH